MHDTIVNRKTPELSYQSSGISPQILVTQVKNTVPFIFTEATEQTPDYVRNILMAEALVAQGKGAELQADAFRYYEMCLSAHHATVASFVPTDVDNHIRHKLWRRSFDPVTLLKLRDLISESLEWECRPVSTRYVKVEPFGVLSGHHGEWFSTAVGAYAAMKNHAELEAEADQFAETIIAELNREFEIYQFFRSAKDSLNILRTATIIAHNLGDLNRVVSMWELSESDQLVQLLASNFAADRGRRQKILDELQMLNRDFMATENHRHFALRKPRALRRSAEFLLPIGPFLDEWGAKLAKSPLLTRKELAEVIEALIDGWQRLDGPVGYARALTGICESIPGGITEIASLVPSRIFKTMQTGKLRQLMCIPQERFEAQWQHLVQKKLR